MSRVITQPMARHENIIKTSLKAMEHRLLLPLRTLGPPRYEIEADTLDCQATRQAGQLNVVNLSGPD